MTGINPRSPLFLSPYHHFSMTTSLHAYAYSSYYASCPILLLSLLLTAPLSATRPLRESLHRRQATRASHGATWRPFSHLEDPESEAAHPPALSELKRYLHRFGYLPAGNFTDLFDEGLESALSLYQTNLGLPVTGRLDAATVSQLSLPRCGVTDAAATHASKYAFFSGRPSWDRARPFTLTYAFARGRGRVSRKGKLKEEEVRGAFARAFRRWAEVIPVKFEEETGKYGKADVRIGFYKGEHGDREPFDGVLGILAHAFSPENGRLHLDAAETWAVDFHRETSPVAVDLESVATHEIGHVLGLGHSSVKEAVMYPSLSPRAKKRELTVDDVKGVQALYGSNPNFSLASLAQFEASTACLRFRGGWWWSEIVAAAVMTALLCIM